MYALRAVAVSLSVFVLACVAVMVWVRCTWPLLRRYRAHFSETTLANVLLALELAPVICATLSVVCFALPSFLRFEPLTAEEEFGLTAALLAATGLVFLAVRITRSVASLRRMRSAAANWELNACVTHDATGIQARTCDQRGLLAVTGLFRQELFVSPDVAAALSRKELDRAIAHEMVHVHRKDNFAKLAVILCRVPGMYAIERAWLEAVEMAADEGAVRSKTDALDLASALVKVSRLRSSELPELALGFAAKRSSLSARIERLLAWQEDHTITRSSAKALCVAPIAIAVFASLAAYHPILVRFHLLTEWLMQ